MTVRDIATLVEGEVICGRDKLDLDLQSGFASDLMSDVLTLIEEDLLFITGLATTQAIRTAIVSDIEAVLLVRNKKATAEMKQLATSEGLVLIQSPFSMYRSSGILYHNGLSPVY
jgi:predicted transcriptional regulator